FFLGGACEAADADTELTNPLLLSGLAFGGANRRNSADDSGNDGILTAEEVVSLDLSSVDLVVLSACNTALGVVRPSEGVLGLRRAFAIAGARTMIMTLWSVEDRATQRWMRAFYEARFTRAATFPEAMRDAARESIDMLRARGENTHPSRW